MGSKHRLIGGVSDCWTWIMREALPKRQALEDYRRRIFLADSREVTRSASLELVMSPAFMVVSRSGSSPSDSHTNRMMSAGSGSDRPPAWEFTIPEVRPMRSTLQLLPCSSLNVRIDVTEPVARVK